MSDKVPARFARFLKWFCPAELYEGIEGDLMEQFERDLEDGGIKRAKQKFRWNVIKFFRPEIILRNKFSLPPVPTAMMKSDFKISYRNLKRNRIYSLINICGLTLSITLGAYVAMYILDELSYDKHLQDSERIYRVSMVHRGDSDFNSAWTPPPVGYALKEHFPEVESFATFHKYWKNFSVSLDDKVDLPLTSIYFANPDCFNVFSFSFLEGNPKSALASLESVVISKTLSDKLFKGSSPLGKSLQTTFGTKIITGLLAEDKLNTHLESPEIILSILSYFGHSDILQNWSYDATTYNYIKVKQSVSFEDVRNKFGKAGKLFLSQWNAQNQNKKTSNDFLQFQPLEDIHLYSHKEFEIKPNGNPMYLYGFSITGILLLMMASINYMNLATAKSTERTKEVGVRKTLGTTPGQLIRQFLTESFILTLISSFCSLVLLWMLLPFLNSVAGKLFLIADLLTPVSILVILSTCLMTGLLGGLYPSLVTSRCRIVDALKGVSSHRYNSIPLRKILVASQFVASMVLLIGTLAVYLQLRFANSHDLGFNKDQVIAIEITSNEDVEKLGLLKNSFESLANVESVGLTAQLPGGTNIKTESFQVEIDEGGFSEQLVQYAFVDENFAEVLDLQVTLGRGFLPTNADEFGTTIIVNELMVKRMGWKHPLGKRIKLPIGKDAEIVGVIKDFHIRSLHDEIQPLILIYLPDWANILLVKVGTSDFSKTLSGMKHVYAKAMGDEAFPFTFLDQQFQQQYLKDEQRGKLFAGLAGITVFITCIGLLGLVGISISHRTKEFGIRKILGATVSNNFLLLSSEYVMHIVSAFAVSIPLSYYLVNLWLTDFAYRIELNWWMFAFPGACVVLLTLLIVWAHALKANFLTTNNMLRNE